VPPPQASDCKWQQNRRKINIILEINSDLLHLTNFKLLSYIQGIKKHNCDFSKVHTFCQGRPFLLIATPLGQVEN